MASGTSAAASAGTGAKHVAAPRRALPTLQSTASVGRRLPLAPDVRDVDRRARPVHAVWELTLACDLACNHCGSRAGRARPDELTVDEALGLVAQLADLGVQEVTLIGGEAYLYPGFISVVEAIRAHGMSCAIVTGGRGLDRERAAAAQRAGVQSVSVSLDGDADSHDRLRGVKGAHAAALAALESCRALGLDIALNSQINRLNIHTLDELCDRVLELRCHGWQLMLTVPAGRAADHPEWMLQPYDLLALFPALARVQERCRAAGVKFLPGNNVGYYGPFEQALRGALRSASDLSCAAGRLVIGIEANGDIKGCPSLPTRGFVGGNLREHALRDIWQRAEALRFTRERDTRELWGYCATCYYADNCKAGCTWTAASLFGRPGNNPYCHHRALEHARLGTRERLVLRSAAPGESFDHGLWDVIVEPLATTSTQENTP